MQRISFQPIFVIGAPRSGTHILAISLVRNLDCSYRSEINNFWKSSHPCLKTDFIPENFANPKLIKRVRKRIETYMKNTGTKAYYLEKTIPNSLRIGYIRKIFPEAIFIHIIRDGRSVAYSIRKQYFGNINKITQFGEDDIKKGDRIKLLCDEIKGRAVTGVSPLLLIFNFNRYFKTTLMRLGLLKRSTWGPRYPGFEYKAKHLTPIQLAGDQWTTIVSIVKNYFTAHPTAKYYECRYEELLKDPDICLTKIIEKITGKLPKNIFHDVISAPSKNSFINMNDKEQIELNEIISNDLKLLGYE
jgi:hypothetical protein